MPTPPKPYKVIEGEKRSHRTKAELKQRKEAEEALTSGEELKEQKEVKKNKIAHKQFIKITKNLKQIGKNDALYETVINRYCLIYAECYNFEIERTELLELLKELKEEFDAERETIPRGERLDIIAGYAAAVAKINGQIGAMDKALQSKRKMLLDIEKENVMTIASALRSIPKKETKEEDPLLAILKNG